ncbi:MAG TPA: hypothetical protein VF142_05095 [Longimicrobium sp.]
MDNQIQPRAAAAQRVPPERRHVRALLAANPNYFGTAEATGFKAAAALQGNTTYEELKCVGYDPQFEQLQAVVWTYKGAGYNGGLCSPGSSENVRFYLSYDGGATWHDQGLASFTAWDTGLDETLEHAVTLRIDPRETFCSRPRLPRVRAILEWNVAPPPNTPNHVPVWGNVRETNIQIGVFRRFYLKDLVQELKLSPEIAGVLNPLQPLSAAEPPELSSVDLHKLYEKADVPLHRFLYPELQKGHTTAASLQALDIDAAALAGQLEQGDGNTGYEELGCIGLDPNLSTLVGILRVKRAYGYSGGLCTAGSREYVAFYLDLGAGWTYAGTTSVNTHDLAAHLPAGGVDYACHLPVDLSRYRLPCNKGPRVVRMRAILSWQVPPPPGDPDWTPVWGNREETHLLLPPGTPTNPNVHPPVIETVGGMSVTKIGASGLADGTAATAGFTADDSPFGGVVIITGHVANPPDISQGAAPLFYRVLVSGDGGGSWQVLNDTFAIGRSQLQSGVWSFLPDINQVADPQGWYVYREDLVFGGANAMITVHGNVLHRWQTAGKQGDWLIKAEVTSNPAAGPQYSSAAIKVRLDNTAPAAAINITTGGGNCADFTIGDLVQGTFTATDTHYGAMSLHLLPPNGGTFTQPAPMPAYPASPTGVVGGTWALDTTGLPRCGYVVQIHVRDRTIVNSGFVGWHASATVGLCLRTPGE